VTGKGFEEKDTINNWLLDSNRDSSSIYLMQLIPEIGPTVGFNQNNPYHHLDVWGHTVEAISTSSPDLIVRLALLFHDIGKPHCYTEDERGGHFYGHPKVSAEIAEKAMRRLVYDFSIIYDVVQLMSYHDATLVPSHKHIKRWLSRIGEVQFRRLLEVKRADTLAHHPDHTKRGLSILEAVNHILDEILAQQQCFSLKDLAVNGRDLMEIGIPQGVEIGVALNKLMDLVIDDEVMNEKPVLLRAASEMRRQ